jgi:uncharacterized protein (DUF433 family)
MTSVEPTMTETGDLLDQYMSLSEDRRQLLAKHLHRLMHTEQKSDPFPTIVQTEGICGGSARIIRTRIPVWLLEQLRRDGTSDAAILDSYPTLTKTDLIQAWDYAEEHKLDINEDIVENEAY